METDLGQLQGAGRWGGMHGREWVCPGSTGTLCFIWLLIYTSHLLGQAVPGVGGRPPYVGLSVLPGRSPHTASQRPEET